MRMSLPFCTVPKKDRARALLWAAILAIALGLSAPPPGGQRAQAVGLPQEPPTPIQEIQSRYAQEDDSAYVGQSVTVQGIVTGVFGDLFFIQAPEGGPFSGIAVYRPGHQVTPSDRVEIQGTVIEFHDITQIEPTQIRILASNQPLPAPVSLSVQEAKAEQWEGVLVQVENVVVTDPPDRFGEWRIRDDSGIIRVDDKGVFYPAEPGQLIPRLTAIVDHAFGTYRLIPRTLEDIAVQEPPPPAPPEELTPVYAIQGPGLASPLERTRVSTVGVVTAVTADGFFLQDPQGDGDPRTSDGIFVYTDRRPQVRPGECVLVQEAAVQEYYEKTELARAEAIVPVDLCPSTPVEPVPVPMGALNTAPAEVFEPYEGMWVALDSLDGLVEGPTRRFRNGDVEIALVDEPLLPYIPGGRVFRSSPGDVAALVFLSNRLGVELPPAAWGDRVIVEPAEPGQPVQAVIDYSFGKYQFLLLPGQTVRVEPRRAVQDTLPQTPEQAFTVCTFNVQGLGRGGEQYRDEESYARALRKRARAIAEALDGCTVVGLQETGTPEDAQNLATVLAQEHGLPYTAIAFEGPNSKSLEFPLTNSLLVRSDRVTVLDAALVQGCSKYNYGVRYIPGTCPRGQYGLFNRPPLVVDLAVDGPWGAPYTFTVIVNHWKSKGGDESVNVVRRTLQAEHVASLVQQRLDRDPQARVVVLGDLNDFYDSGPVNALRNGTTPRLIHTYDFLRPLERYTFIFNGASQVLDHILITPGVQPAFARVDPVHVNVDFPAGREEDTTVLERSSDHDPVVMVLRPGGAGWIGGNVVVPGVEVTARDAADTPIARAVSDAQGEFRLWDLPPGTYRLTYRTPEGVEVVDPERLVQVVAGAGVYYRPQVRHPAAQIGLVSLLASFQALR